MSRLDGPWGLFLLPFFYLYLSNFTSIWILGFLVRSIPCCMRFIFPNSENASFCFSLTLKCVECSVDKWIMKIGELNVIVIVQLHNMQGGWFHLWQPCELYTVINDVLCARLRYWSQNVFYCHFYYNLRIGRVNITFYLKKISAAGIFFLSYVSF